MYLALLLLGCGPKSTAPEPTPEPAAPEATPARPVWGALKTTPVEGMPELEAHIDAVTIDGTEHALAIHKVAAAGEERGGATFGTVPDGKGGFVPWPADREDPPEGPFVCNVIDFTALVHTEEGWFHAAHNECPVGGVTFTPLDFAADGSGFTVGTHHPVDFTGVGGTTTNCSGDITSWGTMLSSEEYDSDARNTPLDGLPPNKRPADSTQHPYDWSELGVHSSYRDGISHYDFGWIPELTITAADGSATVVKHTAMGRFSHELSLVMPDDKTVYMSDDQSHGGFFLFVADTAGDLSAGTLYAARWNQRSETEAGLDWVNLGHATDAEVQAAIDEGVVFTDLFEAEPLSEEGACPEGFSRGTHTWGTECLKTDEPVLASRLETRRYASILGATTEFTKGEGLAVDPRDRVVYFATSRISGGMLEEQTEERGAKGWDYRRSDEQDHIRLSPNRCGIVWGMRPGEGVDSAGNPIPSEWVVRDATAAISGVEEGEKCSEASIAGPDNITFADHIGWLFIAEDTRAHDADTLWAVDMWGDDQTPVPLVRVDKESEVTGIHWFDVDGRGWLTLSNQWDEGIYPEKLSVAGLLGPFPLPDDE